MTAGTKHTAGKYLVDVITDNPADVEAADWSFGDPLTYNDPKAAAYGTARFANLEGLLGNTKRRYNVFTERNRCRFLAQAETRAVGAFAIQHAIAMHYRRCVKASGDGLPIPQPQPVPDSSNAPVSGADAA